MNKKEIAKAIIITTQKLSSTTTTRSKQGSCHEGQLHEVFTFRLSLLHSGVQRADWLINIYS